MATLLRSVLAQNSGQVRLCEAHDRASTELVRDAVADNGQSFDGVWISGLTQTTMLGVPDTELVSPLRRALLMTPVHKPMQRNGRPLCAAFDADSGGDAKDIPALVAVLAIHGVSMIIIEDKAVARPGDKVNSLLATSNAQSQADRHEFANVIRAFKAASADVDVMIAARIESFTTRAVRRDPVEEQLSVQTALRDALERARVYTAAGVDAVMIHSKSREPDEVLGFLNGFRAVDAATPLVVVPTAYSQTKRSVLAAAGANVFIYANHLMRAKIKAAAEVLEDGSKADAFAGDEELRLCWRARNYGCLLRRLAERRYLGQGQGQGQGTDEHHYGMEAEKKALENIENAVKDLAGGQLCGCEADARIVTVKELLSINARQVSPAGADL
ncbi:Pyruvate/Phosphoenolpyruvate kinase [Metarhizium guizhouense ARSEF 977]|uniref:Pyruvate/Phosphoenolpyruvate kinase n=1 Tax=Metarhizium guizhouense (strain ARSEF 977) TaxID=1276136 RepID=A0A0B4GVS6_METGA|nr:Pyruvate/Phosphoenolpyruvate kinase [Metarhizium guizhouense ARSEF 977]